MSNVIEFQQKHFKSGTVRCEHCAHEWVAVWPVNSEPLECPKCGLLKGREFYGPSLYDYIKLPNGATVTDALDAYLQGVKEGKKQAKTERDEPVDISDKSEPTNAAMLPNGAVVSNVYEAYEAGLKGGTKQDDEPVGILRHNGQFELQRMVGIPISQPMKLYEHPAPQKPFVRLSEEEIDDEYESMCELSSWFDFREGVRFAEKHHGIGGDDDKQS